MSPGSERPAPTKKSLRIWVRNNGHVKRREQRLTYVYPRTVEAAKDPFVCSDGKNKMFYLIAINLFPDSKIVKPDESDSESDMMETETTHVEQTEEVTNAQSMTVAHSNNAPEGRRIRQRTKKRMVNPDASSEAMTDPCGITQTEISQSETDESSSTEENTSQVDSTPSVPFRAKVIKRKYAQRHRANFKNRNPKKNDENKTNCSKMGLGCENSLPVTGFKLKGKGSNQVVKKMTDSNVRKTAPSAIPNIVNSLQKIIQNCSESGVISFSLSKKPCQSRS